MASRQPKNFTPTTQPKTYKLTLKAILSLPFRLCNPPPAVGKVRSCGVTPLLKVRLEDVLERQHLPPLGLKDFEEWLLFVEMSPENLYFILWLREYKLRYNQWKAQAAFQNKNAPPDFPLNWSAQYSSHLAMFYARAKQTFFTPGSEYELNLSSSLLAPFHKANMPPHPDPQLFREVEVETYRTLEASLRRFVHAQLNNVGNSRVLCGIVAGIVFCLVGCLTPLIMNFVRGDSRWTRLVAFPGLWLGLTVLVASLNGICLGVYIFGDLRQLRKFELSRPPISKPQPLPTSFRPMSMGARPPSRTNSILPIQQPRNDGASLSRIPSTSSLASRVSDISTSNTMSTDDNIHISPAYFDADDVDAMDMDLWSPIQGSRLHVSDKQDAGNMHVISPPKNLFTATATFIHPFDPTANDVELSRALHLPSRHQPLSPFDFDSLPTHPNYRGSTRRHAPAPTVLSASSQGQLKDAIASQIPSPPEPAVPASFIGRMQEKCNFHRWRLQAGYIEEAAPSPTHPSSPYWLHHNHSAQGSFSAPPTPALTPTTPASRAGQRRSSDSTEKRVLGDGSDDMERWVWKRFRMIKAVPAFAVPLTRVLSPVVVRGQWEIVVRSACVALLLSWFVLGVLLAVPPVGKQAS